MVGCGNCGWRGLLGQRIRYSGTQAALQRQQQQVLRVLAERPLTRTADDDDLVDCHNGVCFTRFERMDGTGIGIQSRGCLRCVRLSACLA